MSTIRQTPYIEELLASMSEQNLNDLKTILDSGGNNVNLDFEHLIADTYKNKVTPVYFKFEDNGLKTGILIWTDTKCALICYHRFQDLIIFELDPTYHTYEKIKQYCDINELRRVLDDTIEKTGAIDSGDADKGQIPVADGEGGVEWKDNFQELVLTNQSGTLTDDEIALAKEGNTVARLGSDGQFYYKDAQNNYYVIFKAAARVANDDTIVEKITIDLSDNTYSYSYDVVAAGESFTPTYDDELSDASTNAVQNKVVTKALNDTVADIESGRTIVGKAQTAQALDNVSENSGSTQEDPFIAQGTGTNNNTSETPTSPKAHQLEKQGNTIVYNQPIENGNFEDTSWWDKYNASWSVNNNVATIHITGASGGLYKSIPTIAGHKYLLAGTIYTDGNTNGCIRIDGIWTPTQVNTTTPNFFKKMFNGTGSSIQINIGTYTSSSGYVYAKDVYLIDLTQWFSGDIPSYLLSHPEAFINYYNGNLAYNEGTLETSNGRYLITIGFNQLNPATSDNDQFIGNYYIQTALHDYVKEADNDFNCYRIRVIPNTNYCISKTKNETLGNIGIVRFVDEDYNLISGNENGYSATQKYVVKTPSNCAYIEISISKYADYKVCINLSWDGERNGEYVDFVKYPYDTGTEVLRSAGSVRDIKKPNGTITRNVGTVTFTGTESWTYNSTSQYFQSPNIENIGISSTITNLITDSGLTVRGMYYQTTNYGRLRVYLADNPQLDNSSNMNSYFSNGKVVNFQLSTPTTEQGTPFDEIIDVDDYGTMYWLDDNEDFVEVPQGCKLFYPADYALLIDDLGNYTGYDVTKLAKKSELDTTFETYLKGLTGYDATKTQKLQNVEGTLTWVDEE